MLANDFVKNDDRGFTPTDSSRSASYFCVLVLVKMLRCVGIFFIDILTKTTHVVDLLWLMKLIASIMLVPVQKAFSQGKNLRKSLMSRIGKLAFINSVIEVLWFYGITFCGPLRSILVFELSPSVILVAVASFFKSDSTPAKSRGLFLLIVGFASLFLMDRDATIEASHQKAHAHHSGLNHLFYHLIGTFGVNDHQGGVFILLVALLLRIGYETSFRHLAVEIGGPKRLQALVTLGTTAILTPLTVLSWTLSASSTSTMGYFEFLVLVIIATAVVFVIDFYAESICFQHVADPVMAAARWSPITMFSCALGLAYAWYGSQNLVEHALTGGVVITVISFILASISLTSTTTPKHRGGHYVGISATGLPLFTYGEAFLQRTSKSMMLFVKETLHEILANSDSRKIFYFLCLNIAFCGVEFLYGFWTNSLGLISDGFHMLFDCSALVMGLVASVMSRWPPSRRFTYGFGRVEILSGFINALFLCVIALFILIEALERLFDPPNINTDRLLFVAVSGLLVNLFGMYSLGEHGHSHGGSSHSHGGEGHGHSHGNANMQGVFLHVLADTLGSVFVIISTLLMQWFGWKWVDPLCSLILSILIIGSVYHLLIQSVNTLLQDIPDEMEQELQYHMQDVLEVEGVKSYSNVHLWQLKSDIHVGSVHVQLTEGANSQMVRHKVAALLKSIGVTQTTVQVEKDAFRQKIVHICPSYKLGHTIERSSTTSRSNGHGHSHGGGHSHSHDHGGSHHGHSH